MYEKSKMRTHHFVMQASRFFPPINPVGVFTANGVRDGVANHDDGSLTSGAPGQLLPTLLQDQFVTFLPVSASGSFHVLDELAQSPRVVGKIHPLGFVSIPIVAMCKHRYTQRRDVGKKPRYHILDPFPDLCQAAIHGPRGVKREDDLQRTPWTPGGGRRR